MRLSAYLAQNKGFSRHFAKKLILNGKVKVNGSIQKKDIEVSEGLDIVVDIELKELKYVLDDYLLKDSGEVIFFYKPPLMHTERISPEDFLCLSDIVEDKFPQYKLISRLDYGVDGVVPVMKKGLELKSQSKSYLAWVSGNFPAFIKGNYLVDAHKRRKVNVYEDEKGIYTSLKLLKSSKGRSLIEINLEKAGRHQVRATCAYLGYPIINDYIYGEVSEPKRIYLHCQKVVINGIECHSPMKESFITLF